ncbi:MAG: hypothetical protein LUQ12_05795, partial [Methanoregulaceae archaeon]|nr:hypothetical protein [Methanoregulaceae archaeon]
MQTLIHELMQSSFSGYAKIIHGSSTMLLVVEKGTPLLAECDSLSGNAAWDYMRRIEGANVDAVLHDLDSAQLKLVIEFNPSARIDARQTGRTEPKKESITRAVHLTGSPEASGKTVVYDRDPFLIPKKPETEPIPVYVWRKGESREKKPDEGEPVLVPPKEDTNSLLSKELDALNVMDIETMASKFRANC